jgi:hypothetical protein
MHLKSRNFLVKFREPLRRIHFCLEDEGLIKTFALGDKFTISHKYIKLLEMNHGI